MAWDYEKGHTCWDTCKKALKLFQHIRKKTQNQPFPHTPIKFSTEIQYTKQESTASPVNPTEKKFIQKVCGKFLFYGQAVDSIVLTPISTIASQSANPTKETLAHTNQLLDYLATQEDAVLTYNCSKMIMVIHNNASYLCKPKAKSRAGGHFFMCNNAEILPNKGAILDIAHIIKHVMTLAMEAKLAALYIMAQEAVYMRIILEEMGHKQPATPIQTDNVMAEAAINAKITPKRSKAMDMRFHWLKDRECQHQFKFYWQPGKQNHADYWTKHHSAAHHVKSGKNS
jgi:hypothetical protein